MSASPEEQEQIRQQIPDIEIVEAQELTRYQKTVKRNLLTALSRLKDEQNRLAEEIRSIAAKDIYAEDYFKKTSDSLLTQTARIRLRMRASWKNLKLILQASTMNRKTLKKCF